MLKLVDPPASELKKSENGVVIKTAHLWRQNGIYLLFSSYFVFIALVVLEKCVECEIPLLKNYDELGPM